MEDLTRDRMFQGDYTIFIERLRTNLSRQGRRSVRLIENKKRFNDLRGRELEGERDDFGQGERSGGGVGRSPDAVNPDFALYGKAMDLPGRGTTYYNLQFDLVDLHTRDQVWSDMYEVRVSRK
jgi:hypothetical protein